MFAAVGPDFGMVLVFTAVLAVLIVAYGGSFTSLKEGQVLISAGIGVGFVAVRFCWRASSILADRPGARLEFARAARAILRDWGPLIIMMWLFQSLETYVGIVRTTTIDDYLLRADVALFGVEPSVWLSKYNTPLLTDYMAFAYGLYFITPMVVAVMLSIRGLREDFREMCTALVLQLGIAFVLFLIFPAASPRYYQPLVNGVFDPPQLHSFFGLYEVQQTTFATADPLRELAAFPSLHCSLAWMTLAYSRRFSAVVFPRFPRLWFHIVLPLVISLWISTIYLRHHWVVDIFAGIALGILANWLAPILRRRWPTPVQRR
jgi:membrane-associated phospholipid phosphatase